MEDAMEGGEMELGVYRVCVCGPIIYGHLIPTLAPGCRINLSQGLLDFKAAALLQLDMFAAENWADGTAIRSAV